MRYTPLASTPTKGAWMKVTNPKRIATARRKLGYTQTDLAALVGVTQQYVSLLESGADSDCSERVALAITRRLNLELEDVFTERHAPKAGA